MKNIYVFAFATFGHPNDFRQSAFVYDQESFARNIKIFDLSNGIKVFPNSTIYAIRKELVNGIFAISYSIYTYAKEQKSTREGTFIGSSIVYTDGIPDESITIDKLSSFHASLIEKNIFNDTLTVSNSRDFIVTSDSKSEFDNIDYTLKNIDNIYDYFISNKKLVVFSRIGKQYLIDNLKKSLDLLNIYDTIYFTDNEDVSTYSSQRDIYKVVSEKHGFKNEIESVQNIQKQKVHDYILYLKNEKQKFETEKDTVISIHTNQIEINKRIHSENERILSEAIRNVENIPNYYSQFLKSIDDFIYQLTSGNKLYPVKSLYDENKITFNNNIADIKINNDVHPITQSNIQNTITRPSKDDGSYRYNYSNNDASYRYNYSDNASYYRKYKVFAFLSLFTILLASIIFFIWRAYNNSSYQEVYEQEEQRYKVTQNSNTNDSTYAGVKPFPLKKASFSDNGSTFRGSVKNNSVTFEGTVTDRGAEMLVEDRILLNGAKKIIIKVKGTSTYEKDILGENRLFKLNIDNKIAKAVNSDSPASIEQEYIKPIDGEYEFPLSDEILNQRYIKRIEVIFSPCTIKNLNLSFWLE